MHANRTPRVRRLGQRQNSRLIEAEAAATMPVTRNVPSGWIDRAKLNQTLKEPCGPEDDLIVGLCCIQEKRPFRAVL